MSRLFIICILTLVWSASPSFAQKRIALVIGNSKYTNLQSLPNPGNDARLMAQTLRKLNFEVVSASDVDFLGMRRVVKKFGRKLRASGKDAVGLFYYAGHGVQARGSNFLVPLGAEISDEADLEIETFAASYVLAQMEAAGNSLNLVILDACRNNPFKGKMRSIARGLARLNAASGSLVAFAAAPGQVASDGIEGNSPYTKALVAAMQVPGLTVEQMFKRVRVAVEAQTNNRQTPWEESSLKGEFYFTPKKEEPKAVARPLPKPVVDYAAREWINIQHTQSTGVLKAFINRHSNSIYASYARTILEEKVTAEKTRADSSLAASASLTRRQQIEARATERAYWNSIQSSNSPDLFKDYIARYPNGNFTVIAMAKLEVLKKPKEQKIASLQRNSVDTYTRTPLLSPSELTFLLQQELIRVGCNPGPIDGQWGRKGRRALTRFKRFASLRLPFKDISPEVVDAVKQQRTRVCPILAPVKVRKTRVRKTKTAVESTVAKTPSGRRKKTSTECSWQVGGTSPDVGEVVCK